MFEYVLESSLWFSINFLYIYEIVYLLPKLSKFNY